MPAVGSIVVTASDIGAGYTKYSIAWTCDASGIVSGNPVDVRRGLIRQVKFIPAAGGVAPTDLYDLTFLDADSADVLVGNGANLSATVASWYSPANPVYHEAGAMTPVIANAGNAKQGTIVLIVGP